MSLVTVDRLPLPNIRVYTCGSVLAFAACVYLAAHKKPMHEELLQDENLSIDNGASTRIVNTQNQSGALFEFLTSVFSVMVREPISAWIMMNMAFCCLLLLAKLVQRMVFGDLRVSEQQQLKDKFFSFFFYRFIFVFGVINVQYIDEVLLWGSWFGLLGFFNLLSQLCKDRFEYLSFSPTTPAWSHAKLLLLLGLIFISSGFMMIVAVAVGFQSGINTFAFMSAEVLLLNIRTLHIIIRYILHIYEIRRSHDNNSGTAAMSMVNIDTRSGVRIGNSTATLLAESRLWEQRGPFVYFMELFFELGSLCIDLAHHLHMLVWSNIFLSMASLVICMQLRYLFHEIQLRYRKHRNYQGVRRHLERNYPMASKQELSANGDNCAICWEHMETARRLPCTHLFHNTCLLSWLEQDTSCPTCRMLLNIQNDVNSSEDVNSDLPHNRRNIGQGDSVRRRRRPNQTTANTELSNVHGDRREPQNNEQTASRNHSFHFDGSRYLSWLPSFSVEVSHTPRHVMMTTNHRHHYHHHHHSRHRHESNFDAMARQVQQMFAHIPISTILDDLRVTQSIDGTVENILDGLLDLTEHNDVLYEERSSSLNSIDSSRSVAQLQGTISNNAKIIPHESEATGKAVLDQKTTTSDNNDDIAMDVCSRFSKSSSEREKILQFRKQTLLHNARKRYMEKQKSNQESSGS